MTSESTPRTLRQWRERHALTQEQLVEQLLKFARDREGIEIGVTAAMVSNWETGRKGVSPPYRRLLADYFGTTPDQLGLGPPLTLLPGERATEADVLAATADGLVLPIPRRAVLALTVVTQPPTRGSPDIADLSEAVDATMALLTAMYPWAPADELLPQVIRHLERLEGLAQRTRGTANRRLMALCGEAALLSGRILFSDLGRPIASRGYLNLALESAREARQPALAAAALGWLSLIPASEHRRHAATLALGDAHRCASAHDDVVVRAWLITVRSQVLTLMGKPSTALQALAVAERLLHKGDHRQAHRWLDIDPGRLAGLQASALVGVGQVEAARAALEYALEALAPNSLKQRAVLLADLATVLTDLGETEQAEAAAARARQILAAVPLAGVAERLRQSR